MPCWDILLYIYSLIFVPVLYSFLLGVNLLVWARSRINYKFVFGKDGKFAVIFIYRLDLFGLDLDVTSNLDYQQYFEVGFLDQHSCFCLLL